MSKKMVSPDGTRITGSYERIYGVAQIIDFDDEGEPNYEGTTDVNWDSQETIMRHGERVFVDEDGDEYLEGQCKLVDEDD